MRRKTRNILEQGQLKVEFQETLLRTQLEIQEQTLKNISQEIHDNVGQVLSLAKLNLNTMDVAKTEQLQGKIDNTLSQVSKAINDLRDLSKSFNTDNITAIGLVRAIESELEMIKKTDFLKTEFNSTGVKKKLEPQKELILFRIVQEALHNIIKHAGAKTVKVSATYTDKDLELQIADDGKGFDLSPINQEGETGFGLGLRNMQNRAKLIGADFSMNSMAGEGTFVKIILPFANYQQNNK
ncbi:MAG TPA: sensor histidine kinase [Chitinophagaceae bacterium]|nr:sensor histidine kinase [Chitinophagaceae bacterium]